MKIRERCVDYCTEHLNERVHYYATAAQLTEPVRASITNVQDLLDFLLVPGATSPFVKPAELATHLAATAEVTFLPFFLSCCFSKASCMAGQAHWQQQHHAGWQHASCVGGHIGRALAFQDQGVSSSPLKLQPAMLRAAGRR